MTIFNAVATVRDDAPPTLAAGGPLLAGGWHRPADELVVDASDVDRHQLASPPPPGRDGHAGDAVRLHADGPVRERHGGELQLTGLADGSQPLTVTVKDAAGNPRPRRRTINVDGTPPYVEWQPRVRAHALGQGRPTRYSGVAGGQISVDGTALPTTLANGRLTATAAGQARRRRAGHRLGRRQRRQHRVRRAARGSTCAERVRARNGRPVTLRGRLLTPAGGAIPNVPIAATATIARRGATAEPAGTATTDARGRFALRLPAGPSRTVRLTVSGGGGLLPLVRAVAVRVPASSTIHASRRARERGDARGLLRPHPRERPARCPRAG